MSLKGQVASDIVKATPPLTVMTTHIFGVNWSDLAYMATTLYTIILILHHAWKNWIKPRLPKRSTTSGE